ncbi:MAG: GntR family transcriptional regulator [Pseudonocardia sp.]
MVNPKPEQLTDTLRERVLGDSYPDGRIPSEAALVAEFGVSRTTVRSALTALQNEGLLRAQPGVGYFVRRFRHFTYRPQDDFRRKESIYAPEAWTKAVSGQEPTQRIEVMMVAAPSDVARRLQVPEGEFVVLRSRMRMLDEEPFQINDSYYPRDVAEGTEAMQPESVARGVNQVLADHGHAQVRAMDEFWVRMPNPDEVHRLRIPPGTPVAEHLVTGFTASGRAVRMARTVLPGDRNVILYERTHPEHEAEFAG